MTSLALRTVPATKPKRSSAWPQFANNLAAALEAMQEDQYLVLSVKRSGRFVQLAAQGAFGVRVETTSNGYLAKDEKLDHRQIDALVAMDWITPTGQPDAATPDLDPDGSPNFFVEFAVPVPYESVAQMAVKTSVEILHVPHPSQLEYEAADLEGGAIILPGLGLRIAKRKSSASGQETLPQLLLKALKKLTDNRELEFDRDGDVAVRHGNAVIFVRAIDDPLCVRIYSPVLREVDGTADIVDRLNDINARELMMRFVLNNGSIFALAEISATPFVETHLTQALEHFCSVVGGLESLLQAEFGGHTAFAEATTSLLRH